MAKRKNSINGGFIVIPKNTIKCNQWKELHATDRIIFITIFIKNSTSGKFNKEWCLDKEDEKHDPRKPYIYNSGLMSMDKPKKLTIKEMKFIDGVFEGKTYTDAFIDAGYVAKNRASAGAGSSRLLKTVKIKAEVDRRLELIERFNRVRLARVSESAVAQLNKLVLNATEKDGVKLAAVKDALDRIGLKPPEKLNLDGTMHFVIEHVKRDDS